MHIPVQFASGLSYPAGVAPGVDVVNYPGIVFSAVPVGSNFISLRQSNKRGTRIIPSAPTVAVNGPTGPSVQYPNAATDVLCRIEFPGNIATNLTSFTMLAIVTFTSFTATQLIIGNDSSGAGNFISASGVAVLTLHYWGGATKSSGITLTAGVPYFIVVSGNGTTSADFFVLRLDTGAITVASTTGSTPSAPNGTFTVGNGPGGGGPVNGTISAAAILSGYTAPPAVKRFALNPWKLWYP